MTVRTSTVTLSPTTFVSSRYGRAGQKGHPTPLERGVGGAGADPRAQPDLRRFLGPHRGGAPRVPFVPTHPPLRARTDPRRRPSAAGSGRRGGVSAVGARSCGAQPVHESGGSAATRGARHHSPV